MALALGTAKKRAAGGAKVWLLGALQQILPGPGLRMELIAALVLTGGGLHPAQQPRRSPAALGGREDQDEAGPRQTAEADGGRFPVAEAGGEMLGE